MQQDLESKPSRLEGKIQDAERYIKEAQKESDRAKGAPEKIEGEFRAWLTTVEKKYAVL